MKFSPSTVALFTLPSVAKAVLFSGKITIYNPAPLLATTLTPPWVAIHDGEFDTYDRNAPASPQLERIAEDGNAQPLVDLFNAGSPGRPFDGVLDFVRPQESQSLNFVIDVPPNTDWYFSYASMVIPSNDAFVANGDPKRHLLLGGLEGPQPLDFLIRGGPPGEGEVLDAGTEMNDEVPENTAGLGQTIPDSGIPENGVVTLHPGFIANGTILTAIPQGTFTKPEYIVARVTVSIRPGVGAGGDPHFRRWNGSYYDFMGACDLKLLHAPQFTDDSKALSINVRTKIRYNYSYIESAVVNLGKDTLQVSSFGDYVFNGVQGVDPTSMSLDGLPITYSNPNQKTHEFNIQVSDDEFISVSTFKDMVNIKLNQANPERFRGSLGMLGSFDNDGAMVGRDGVTVFEDPIAMAAEWQVKEDEPMLFEIAKAPQHPAQCVMPSAKLMDARNRRLGESMAYEAAEKACAGWEKEIREACIYDVMATGDLDLATAGAF